ncbi:MAG: hypothetical protein E6713_07420 [Sporomusaceae bacterium]|nr:hypothetical protein [Sporomusaceae bacterium]
MKTITEMQTQIKEMSTQLNSFAHELAEYNGAVKQEMSIDFKQIKAIGRRNPIEGHSLITADADVKKKYITMLIAVAYTATENQENAWLFIQRIATGAKLDEELMDLSVDAVNLTEAQIDEFTEVIDGVKLNNIFALDAMLVYLSCEQVCETMLEFLAALFELLKCGKQELQDLSELAKIIAEQSPEKYVNFLSERIGIDFSRYSFYVKLFYSDIQFINSNCCYVSGKGKKSLTYQEIEVVRMCNSQQVIVEDVVISLKDTLKFESRDSVVFKNCTFTASNYNLLFNLCNCVEFNNCSFNEMSNRVVVLGKVNNFKVINSSFLKCGFKGDSEANDFEFDIGGVFQLINNVKAIEITGSVFSLCYIKSNNGVSGCIMGSKDFQEVDLLKLSDCEFLDCEMLGLSSCSVSLFENIRSIKKSIENNKITGKGVIEKRFL